MAGNHCFNLFYTLFAPKKEFRRVSRTNVEHNRIKIESPVKGKIRTASKMNPEGFWVISTLELSVLNL